MATNPDLFRSMSIPEIVATLAMDGAGERRRKATSAGARCVNCLDAGINRHGRFCDCTQGHRLALQGRGPLA
jgi:hypothetical protein